MKKLSLIGKVVVSLSLILSIAACQKQQDATKTTQSTDENVIKNSAGFGDPAGTISRSDAQEMSETFKKVYTDKNQTQYVAFATKDLLLYLNNLSAKYKADTVYVNLGVYDEKTAKDKASVGRLTVFFSGNNHKTQGNGSYITNDLKTTDLLVTSDYLNHGNIYP